MKNFVNRILRFLNGLKRPSKKSNKRKLSKRGETIESFTFRDATIGDVHELGILHAETWAQTYNASSANYELRQYQWHKSFTEENDGSWFCILVVDKSDKLVGFAKGIKYKDDTGKLSGDLNKIYLLRDYQRIGLGRKLIGYVARRFLSAGIKDMTLFGVPQNPSCAFHEAMGGKRIYTDKGIFDGCFRWGDLRKLAEY